MQNKQLCVCMCVLTQSRVCVCILQPEDGAVGTGTGSSPAESVWYREVVHPQRRRLPPELPQV